MESRDATRYRIESFDHLPSPSLLFFGDLIDQNMAQMVKLAGSGERLCPHVKTHKTRALTRAWLAKGVPMHKCATLVEAEMLAQESVPEILIAYQLVGPNLRRFRRLFDHYRDSRFAVLVDSPSAADQMSEVMAGSDRSVDVYVDLDTGMHRTGTWPDERARMLVESLVAQPQLAFAGLHWYDGQNRQPDYDQRRGEVLAGWERLCRFRDSLLMEGLPAGRVIAAGSGSFPILAELDEPDLKLSPGTTVLYDADLSERFPEGDFQPAVGILTRVVSNQRRGHVTLDVGHKACCADQPAGRRLTFPQLPDAIEVQQTEEHLVIQSSQADSLELGDALVAIPRHACTTVAAHEMAWVIRDGRPVDQWPIAARNRISIGGVLGHE